MQPAHRITSPSHHITSHRITITIISHHRVYGPTCSLRSAIVLHISDRLTVIGFTSVFPRRRVRHRCRSCPPSASRPTPRLRPGWAGFAGFLCRPRFRTYLTHHHFHLSPCLTVIVITIVIIYIVIVIAVYAITIIVKSVPDARRLNVQDKERNPS